MAVGPPVVYHPARPIPFELRSHIAIYIEEQLSKDTQALSLLSGLLVADVSDDDTTAAARSRAAQTASPTVLSLLATLAVHPSSTTRASDAAKQAAADQALQLLYDVKSIVGPVNAQFDTAFSFGNQTQRRMNRRQILKELEELNETPNISHDHGKEDARIINAPVAMEGNIFSRTSDFWQVVGWAFNCAVHHKARWERWRLWLIFMLEAIEDDWRERMKSSQVSRSQESNGSETDLTTLEASMGARIITEASQKTGRTARRRIQRAILADGGGKSLNEFPEIWPNETKERKKQELDVRRKENKVNLDEGQFGDYWDEESDEAPEVKNEERRSTRQSATELTRSLNDTPKAPATPPNDSICSDVESFGSMDALKLRRRLLVILLRIAKHLPHCLATVEEMFDVYTESIRPLPLPIFIALMSPIPSRDPSAFDTIDSVCLCLMLLRPLLAATPPPYQYQIPPQHMLEESFLPFAANSSSIVDNAKVAMLLEVLLRLLWQTKQLRCSEELSEALETGIEARYTKALGDDRRRSGPPKQSDADASKWLVNSAPRLRTIVKLCGGAGE
ncbi:MAG: hypothetical protein M1828_000795 [Chrysothrix sp. TS-e1954]|nr:MAG: hypothetical protein M1828_000795 [Chrysothrix sp. TS-e1954]